MTGRQEDRKGKKQAGRAREMSQGGHKDAVYVYSPF